MIALISAALLSVWMLGVIGLASAWLWAVQDSDFRADFMLDPPLFRWVTLPAFILTWPLWLLLFLADL